MKIDRPLQNELLKLLADAYPDHGDLELEPYLTIEKRSHVIANLHYLADHGLVSLKSPQGIGGRLDQVMLVKATERGIDLIADDGGLGAVLGVVTVRLHEDTLKALLELRITESDIPEDRKAGLIARIRSFPADTVRRVGDKLIELGLDKAADHLGDVLDGIGGVIS